MLPASPFQGPLKSLILMAAASVCATETFVANTFSSHCFSRCCSLLPKVTTDVMTSLTSFVVFRRFYAFRANNEAHFISIDAAGSFLFCGLSSVVPSLRFSDCYLSRICLAWFQPNYLNECMRVYVHILVSLWPIVRVLYSHFLMFIRTCVFVCVCVKFEFGI